MEVHKLQDNSIIFGNPYDEELSPIIKFPTTCCSLAILSIKNYHTFVEIQEVIDYIKNDSLKKKWHISDRTGGEMNIQVICSPGEEKLEDNLKKLGFRCLSDKLKRRPGYPAPNQLKLFLLTF